MLFTTLQWPRRIDQDGGKATRRQTRDGGRRASAGRRHTTVLTC
ncbi:hypothetical protein HMPREF9056_00069 [Actinomyces sp. oral taxon 170 str. F0386]|nr:hypothetical protein HMPREF9056_00069 [Actinomyces sp. oral taxon 170 str. F0386]